MKTFELPQSSKPAILAAAVLLTVALAMTAGNPQISLIALLIIFLVSGFFSDMFTAFFHFGFDYVFPYWLPILGPISREFRDHHDHPFLDPSNYWVNLTKGAYPSIPLSILAIVLLTVIENQTLALYTGGTVALMAVWALFFHQIHSYAHVGGHLHPDVFNARAREIAALPDRKAQMKAFNALFDTVPIPRLIRLLQHARIILNPAAHNIHHIQFETDFSSVNGWSDPVTNGLFRRWAQYYKRKEAASAEA